MDSNKAGWAAVWVAAFAIPLTLFAAPAFLAHQQQSYTHRGPSTVSGVHSFVHKPHKVSTRDGSMYLHHDLNVHVDDAGSSPLVICDRNRNYQLDDGDIVTGPLYTAPAFVGPTRTDIPSIGLDLQGVLQEAYNIRYPPEKQDHVPLF